ncbi:hypothetical protein C6Y14_08670 [Streptomyces dioscori]|uniref:Uncharacterized protein n=1 Tax=Streptomyces dioscori TaxID=2109333 RepID=A0A2P8QCA1_9ACTN|nr:hypothetical protein C6Y14_08670 [Streptomyces dioscori]
MQIERRLGVSPQERNQCMSEANCPDIFELSDGRFVIIGDDITADVRPLLPADAGIGPSERAVVITRETLTRARSDIPSS